MANPIPITFPLGGVSEQAAYAGEPAPNIVRPDHCLNVRPYDSIERRRRGGKRTGVSRFFTDRPDSFKLQFLGTAVEAVALSEDAGWGNKYADPASGGTDARGFDWSPDGGYAAVISQAASNRLRVIAFDLTSGWGAVREPSDDSLAQPGGPLGVAWHPNGKWIGVAKNSGSTLAIYGFDPATGQFTSIGTEALTPSAANRVAFSPDGLWVALSHSTTPYVTAYPFDPDTGAVGSKTADPSVTPGSTVTQLRFTHASDALLMDSHSSPQVHGYDWSASGFGDKWPDPVTSVGSNGNAVGVHPDDTYVVIGQASAPRVAAYPISGAFGTKLDDPDTPPNGTVSGVSFHPDGDVLFLSDAGTSPRIQAYIWDGGFGARITNPSSLVAANHFDVKAHPSGQAVGMATANTSSYALAYEFTPGTVNPSARKTRVVAIQGGSVYRSNHPPTLLVLANSGADAFDQSLAVSGVAAFQKMFFINGVTSDYQYLDFSDNTVKDWSADLTAGALPVGTDDADLAARIITLYRGRVVLSGLREEPQNWFMSRSGDPFNFDYSPAETSPIQAVAGNASNAGELGDVVTALAPHQDDILIMGGASSLWMMRGDPAAGGQIDNISRQTGIVGPDAWTWDAANVLWFFGPNGLYRLAPGSIEPELVSRGKLDRTFTELDTSTSDVRLIYDRQWQGVHMFVTPVSEPDEPVDHWFFDERTGGFWRDRYPTAFGPTAVHLFQGDTAENRAVLLGGFDGRIRHFDPEASDDDGAAMTSFVRFPIMHPGPGLPMGQFQLSEMQVHLGRSSGAGVTLEMYRGHTPQEAAEAATPAFTRSLAAGRNLPIRKRLRGNALQVRLVHDAAGATWAYENGSMMVAGVGRQRARL